MFIKDFSWMSGVHYIYTSLLTYWWMGDQCTRNATPSSLSIYINFWVYLKHTHRYIHTDVHHRGL